MTKNITLKELAEAILNSASDEQLNMQIHSIGTTNHGEFTFHLGDTTGDNVLRIPYVLERFPRPRD